MDTAILLRPISLQAWKTPFFQRAEDFPLPGAARAAGPCR
ncbi:hypothetical protein HMPREF3036_02499 [Sutterella sp. KLE1602]|nr:hypothetical protein HMPREF3036_02499 [Sutterella sp. KLE1602]